MPVSVSVHVSVSVSVCAGPQRQVQDKTFYLGRLRSKIQELNAEVARMSKDLDLQDQQNATYLTYEKK